MKYDCNKTMDYAHEFARMCESTVSKNDMHDCPECWGRTKEEASK